MSNSWVVGDYEQTDGCFYRNVVMKREVRGKRLGITLYNCFAAGSVNGGYQKVKPTNISRVFKTQAEARERKKKLEGRA